MARKPARDVDELLIRAETDTKKVSSRVTQRPAHQASVEPAARRIYNGDPQSNAPGYAVRPDNKRVVQKRRRSTFSIITVLFLAAIGIVVYIGNILTVNQLAADVHQLQSQYDRIVNSNSVLKADINRKSGWERIGTAAKERVGLTYPKERARAFDVEESRLEKFKEQ